MTRTPLDPSLAAILDSIRATVDGAPPAEAPASHAPAPQPIRHEPLPPVRSVEDFLADLARPHVKEWVEANLPEIVQKLVAEEVRRLTGSA